MATMSEDGGPPNKRTKLPKDEYEKMNREELLQRVHELETYLDTSPPKSGDDKQEEGSSSRELEDKLKQQQVEATRRENVLVMRLTTKEQEIQEYINQIQELKQVRNPATTQLRGMLLDPAINLMFQRMKKEMDSCKEKLERAQNDLTAWKFTPDSQTGKRLMAKCRMLLQENEELGKVISAGRTAKLEGEIALEKKFVEEMKKSQAETDEFLVEMDEDTEGMQSTIYFLQQQLKEVKDEVTHLQEENQELRQRCDRLTQALPTDQGSTAPVATHSPETRMDVDMEADSHTAVDPRSATEPQRTPSNQGTTLALTNLSHSITGNNVGNRTKSDGPGEGADALVTSSAFEADHRTLQPSKPTDVMSSSDSQFEHQTPVQQHPQNLVVAERMASTTNGEHMETDVSEEMPSSCDDDVRTEQSNCHAPHGASEPKTLSPCPQSPHNPPTTAPVHGRTQYGQSSDGAYTYEGTDGSSEPWSPTNQSKTSGLVSDDEVRGLDRPRTEGKGCGERLQNGIVTSSQLEILPDTGMAE